MGKVSIKNWSIDDRPREKLAFKGKSSLSNAELLAILIGSGNAKESAVELSKRILNAANDNLLELSRFTVNDFKNQFKGIGIAKAVSIVAALELGHRRIQSQVPEKIRIRSSSEMFKYLYENLVDLTHEEFWVIYLNVSNVVLRKERISSGGFTESTVDVRKIFKSALGYNATNIIIAHNHPSGNTYPSRQDEILTERIKHCGEIFNITLLDHIIIGENSYYSFIDERKL